MSEGGQQRAFANRIKLQSAQQIRQSTRATVKAATEKVSLKEIPSQQRHGPVRREA